MAVLTSVPTSGPVDSVSRLLGLPYTDSVVLLGAIVLGVTSGVLGALAVLRRRSLVGDAIAHSTLPGVCLAFLLAGAKDVPGLLAGAAVAGLCAALLMVATERSGLPPDAAIGVVLAGFFSLGVVLLTHIAGSGNADQAGLANYLFGQAAGLLERDVAVMAAVGGLGVLAVAVLIRPLTAALFDPGHAGTLGLPVRLLDMGTTALLVVAVVVGVRVVGAVLMVAMLVAPAVAARQFTDRLGRMLVLAGLIGAVVGGIGALTATRAELPTGPVVVLVAVLVAVLAVLVAPGRGVLWQLRRLTGQRRRVRRESALTALARTGSVGSRVRRRTLLGLRRAGQLDGDGTLTAGGRAAAAAVADRRELWTAWLTHGPRLRLPDAREPDPFDLPGSIGEEAVARLRTLALTATDPVGGRS